MMRAFTAYAAALALTLASLVLADARGASHDIGAEAVICTGAGMITITLGPDGQPIESTGACPDGTSIFAASFALPVVPRPETRLVAQIEATASAALTTREALTPSARGPPSLA